MVADTLGNTQNENTRREDAVAGSVSLVSPASILSCASRFSFVSWLLSVRSVASVFWVDQLTRRLSTVCLRPQEG